MGLVSANVVICETVLTEKTTEVISAVRIMNVLTVTGQVQFAHFYSLCFLNSEAGDLSTHTVQVQLLSPEGKLLASAPERSFNFGYAVAPLGPGAFNLTTEFTLNLSQMGVMGTCCVVVYVDRQRMAMTPLVIRRG